MSQGIQRESSPAGGGNHDRSNRGALSDALLRRIAAGDARVGIIGLGYVGLPLALAFCDRGIAVLGFDVDPVKVERLQRGESYIKHIPPTTIRAMRRGLFEATADFRRLDEPDAIIICVPTPLTDAREPDLTYVVNSTRSIAERLRPGQLVVLESTTYPGTTREVVLPLLRGRRARSRAATSSWPSAPSARTRAIPSSRPRPSPRSSAASTPPACELAAALYGQVVVRVVPGLQPRGRRGLQDPGEHLPGRQHRPGQRAEGPLRPHGHRRLGGDRRGQDQAVRLPGVLSRARPGRPLHPDRPLLPDLGGPQARPDDPLHRAGRRDQHLDARLRRRQGRRRAQRPRQAGQGEQDHPAGHGLQEGRGRPPRVARLRADGAAAPEGGRGRIQRPAHPHAAGDAPLPPPADVQPGADRRSTWRRATAC